MTDSTEAGVNAALRDLFLEALALRGPAREKWLAQKCRGDDALRHELESLLNASDGAGSYCRQLAEKLGAQPSETRRNDREAEPVPAQIGAYRPVCLLGRGGMGAVYLAERVDDQFEKQVAIKILPATLDAKAAARFLNERQILARLVHPNITRLLDGGLTDDRRPYFVMDYVDGQPLDRFCDEQRLTVEQRIRLFLKVLDAVRYAHNTLVLHRDLKPGNILVTDSGEIQLLDFGVSELLDVEPEGEAATSSIPLTPAYASPEVIRGEAATTAADVYSLGVVLYRLVCGLHPFGRDGEDLHEFLQRVLETPATTAARRWVEKLENDPAGAASLASTRRCETKALTRRLSGDLGAVLAAAVARDPRQRYQSVDQFAGDLEALLEHRPVRVIPGTPGYRVRKFVQRYKAASLLALCSVVLMLALVAVSTTFAVKSRQQTALVSAQRDRAEMISQFLLNLFAQANPRRNPQGSSLTARELLDFGVKRIQRLGAQPELQAALLNLAANAYSHMDLLELARPLLVDALELHRKNPQGSTAAQISTLHRLARVEADLGAWSEAESHAEEARQLLNSQPSEPATQNALSRSLLLLGSMRLTRGDFQAAEAYLFDARKTARQLPESQRRPLLARILSHQGTLASERGAHQQASQLHQQALGIRRGLSKRPTIDVADSLLRLGQSLLDEGRTSEAERAIRRARAIQRELLPEDSIASATAARLLGEIRAQGGGHEAAESLLTDSVAVWRRLNLRAQPEMAVSLASLARLHMSRDQWQLAEPLLAESLAIVQHVQPGHRRVAEHAQMLEIVRSKLAGESQAAAPKHHSGSVFPPEQAHKN